MVMSCVVAACWDLNHGAQRWKLSCGSGDRVAVMGKHALIMLLRMMLMLMLMLVRVLVLVLVLLLLLW
jgi:hypothetical protein